ncbi:TonB-dependent receptor [Christiangramia flava]|uniref:Thiamin-regulated outer membrane receptor Omr1 n=1 Tax=Christiangramia flava JLT2011 TaxID=1229726 RepID=A0A1L7I2Y0_9FLAO|nr:TonB-dependent receptor [Christiangramia flava]APU67967.1 Thiamin-regulated outer membrane receptor Omr1 [Christiangramia flava JLT2011]OSS40468.1 Thiamin-regulated outer membrane receptor Omr1 [Christiangramia flava JLT2011]
MKREYVLYAVCLLWVSGISGQEIKVEGSFLDAFTEVALPQVKISIESLNYEGFSDENGLFDISISEVAAEEYILKIEKAGYLPKRIPVRTSIDKRSLGVLYLEPDISFENTQLATVFLTEAELNDEETVADNISGILQSSRDVFQNAAAFDFSQTFYRPRGLGSEYAKVLINGFEMSQDNNSRPIWSEWGGLNDVQRNQSFTTGLFPAENAFGSLAGTINFTMRASRYARGGRITASVSNRSYNGRFMVTYASGEVGNGWYYTVSGSRRFADEGLVEGTLYDAASFFAAVEKKLSEKSFLNLAFFYTPSERGKSAPLSEEIFELKGRYYNPYWGYQEGDIRNSRIKKITLPVVQLLHSWQLNASSELLSGIMLEAGEMSNSRIDYGGSTANLVDSQYYYSVPGTNPDPAYYQNLPSYFLRSATTTNYESAWRARQELEENGQLDWSALYEANLQAATHGQNAIYAMVSDVMSPQRISGMSNFSHQFSPHLKIDAGVNTRIFRNGHFGRIEDLLGGKSFLDVDIYAEDPAATGSSKQSDLQNFNRLVSEDQRYKYDYAVLGYHSSLFGKVEFSGPKWELFGAIQASGTAYRRNGNYQNGLHPETSLGKSELSDFKNFGLKAGSIYKISGRQNVEANFAWFGRAPGYESVFVNPRQTDLLVPDGQSEKILAGDFSYRFRSSDFNLRLTGYISEVRDATEISFYFTEGLSGLERENTAAFVQEILQNIHKRYYGMEFGTEYQLTPSLKLKSALGLGENSYANNPNLMLSSSAFAEILNYGEAYLKNYHLPGGPQTAAQLGFEYRDTDFWWFSSSLNYFDRSFIDSNPLNRTLNFQRDYDGLPLVGYDEDVARKLLKQEQFDSYFLWNATGGKSWRLKDKYLGLFASLNNILNTLYKTGGFEQSRNSNYRELKEDSDREFPLFASKYWYGPGTSFFINLNLRF